MNKELALKINKFIHEECIDGVPHDIGWNVMKLISESPSAHSLPSDEEADNRAKQYGGNGKFLTPKEEGFRRGAKWMRQHAEKALAEKEREAILKTIEYMIKHPLSEQLRIELLQNFKKGLFVLEELLKKIETNKY